MQIVRTITNFNFSCISNSLRLAGHVLVLAFDINKVGQNQNQNLFVLTTH